MGIINYFPGHIKKTYDELNFYLKQTDLVLYLLDARVPNYSYNDFILTKLKTSKILFVINKINYADKLKVKEFVQAHTDLNIIQVDIKNSLNDIKIIKSKIIELTSDITSAKKTKGMVNPTVNVLIVGIPNVGKSTLINQLVKEKKVKVMNLPGTTKVISRIELDQNTYLIDTPGILWPKFTEQIGQSLIAIGSIRDFTDSYETICLGVLKIMFKNYPKFKNIYYPDVDEYNEDIFLNFLAKKYNCLKANATLDSEKACIMFLRDIRNGKIVGINLEY